MTSRHFFVLSGGAGTRLWPLSREKFPKQFVDLAGTGAPLLIDTCRRFQGLGKTWILTTETLRNPTVGVLQQHKMKDIELLCEPAARNTAPAVAWATFEILQKDPNAVIGFFPADHTIENLPRFREVIQYAFDVAEKGHVVTLGIPPTYPATGFGYMDLETPPHNNQKISNYKVLRFIEKPNVDRAEGLLASRKAVWNAGIFVFPVKLMAELFKKHMPVLWQELSHLKADKSNLKEIYNKLPKESLDYGIMEHLSDIQCVPADMGWSDLGSWEEIAARNAKTQTNTLQINASENFYSNQNHIEKTVAFLGVSDLIAVDSPDALLIMRRGEGQNVKAVVDKIKSQEKTSTLAQAHTFEDRPWGRFEVLLDTDHFKSKRIWVWPKQKLSYQSHNKRAEHWIITQGTAEVTLDDKVHTLKAGEHIYIPLQAKHRIYNPGDTPVEFIEVQTGTYFGEDDIIRYSDDYGRT